MLRTGTVITGEKLIDLISLKGIPQTTKIIIKKNETMKTLHLTLKKNWFDMIASGEKREEYREIKPYWIKRLLNYGYEDEYETPYLTTQMVKKYQTIEFRNGYSKNARKMLVEWHGLSIGQPQSKWFGREAEGTIFIIHLGNITAKNF